MTKLKPIKREIRIHGVESPINLELDENGISLSVKGSRKKVQANWVSIAKACYTETDVPSFLMGKPYELLQHFATKRQIKQEKKSEA